MNPQTPPQPGQNPAESDSAPLKTDIVGNIPMHTAAGPAAPAKEDADLDKIMQDVGHELKKEDVKSAKHHLFSKKQPPSEAKLHAQPLQPQAQVAQNHQQPAAKLPAKPKPEHKAPVLVIAITLLVTVILIAVAISVYKKGN